MKINRIKINQFGKIKDKDIELKNNISIIHGKNEAGKTTILKFIAGMFYGISKNKNGKEISDFEKYEPWRETNYSGKIEYSLDDGRGYEVYRDFRKKNPQIYNDKSEDISKEFPINKNRGNDFFKEQTGMEEDVFYNTILLEQNNVVLEKNKQNELVQKMTNIISTGQDNISYKKTLEKLKNKLIEEVGTERTTERPLNKVEEELRKLEIEYDKLENETSKQYSLNKNEEILKNQIKNQEQILKVLKIIKNERETEEIEKELIKIKEKEIKELKEKIKNKKIDEKKEVKKGKNLTFFILLSIVILAFIFNPIKTINYVLLFIFIAIVSYKLMKTKNERQKKREDIIKQQKEIEILQETIKEKTEYIEEKTNQLNKNIEEKKREIKNLYTNLYIGDMFEKSLEQIKNQIEKEEVKNNELKMNLAEIEIQRKNILPKIDEMVETEERIKSLEKQKEELIFIATSIQIAKQTLEEAYDEIKNSLTPQFMANLTETIKKISNEKYKNIKFNDEEGILVEIDNGEYKKVERLSTGTIFQMYLSLRLAMAREITHEKMPIILDEAFAYYDDERLENILLYLKQNYNQYQIIIFTCTNREKDILDRNSITYDLIEM